MENNRYSLKSSHQVPNAGFIVIRTGLPVHAEMLNDICICCDGSYDFIPCNSSILRKALLRNPNLTEKLLGIEVKDLRAKEVKKVSKETKSKEGTE